LVTDEQYQDFIEKRERIEKTLLHWKSLKLNPEEVNAILENKGTPPIIEKASLETLLKRPQLTIGDFSAIMEKINPYGAQVEEMEEVEIQTKYQPYIEKENQISIKIIQSERKILKPNLNFDTVTTLSKEAREKLKKLKPKTLGEARKISGISQSDLSILVLYAVNPDEN